MTQQRIKAAFIRGGTSKGVFFHARDLPSEAAARDRLLLAALGSPDPYGRQLNGLGGGVSSVSKAVIVAPSLRDDADVEFTFGQVEVDRPFVDYGGTCGNLSSAVGPFAVEEGLVSAARDGEAVVRVFNTNTSKVFHARFPVRGGLPEVRGETGIPGVAGTGARVALEFRDPGGSSTRALLASGNVVDTLRLADGTEIKASLVDATNPVVFVAAEDVGLGAGEHPDQLEANRALMERLQMIRQAAGVAMGLAERPDQVGEGIPKLAVVAPAKPSRTLDGGEIPAAHAELLARAVSMRRIHRALPLTLAMCLATAARIPGSIAHAALTAGGRSLAPDRDIRLANPSGVISAAADVKQLANGRWHVSACRVIRTQRRLMDGHVLVPVDA